MPAGLELHTLVVEDAVVVTVAGEVDIATAPELGQTLTAAIRLHPKAALVCCDLAGVTFLDSTGLNTLANARLEAKAEGVEFCLGGATGSAAKVLRLTALNRVFGLYDSVEAAREAHTRGPDAQTGA